MTIHPTLPVASAAPRPGTGHDPGGVIASDTGPPPASVPETAAVYVPSEQTVPAQATYNPIAAAPTAQDTDWASDSLVAAASGTIIAIAFGQPVMLTTLGAAPSSLPSGPRPQTPSLPSVPAVPATENSALRGEVAAHGEY